MTPVTTQTLSRWFHYAIAYAAVAIAAIPQTGLSATSRIVLGVVAAVVRYVADPSTGTTAITTAMAITSPSGIASPTIVTTPVKVVP